MLFEWDENKRRANIDKHGFDFIDVVEVLDGEHVRVPSHDRGGESRWLAVGQIGGRFATVIYTMRGEAYRIISVRRASHAERRIHEDLHQ
ncbi:MAG: hypothetical protein HW416_1981 [Chloroflexi bacterium]|nr:hypothetical protein [Chloroflexota bacterium]